MDLSADGLLTVLKMVHKLQRPLKWHDKRGRCLCVILKEMEMNIYLLG